MTLEQRYTAATEYIRNLLSFGSKPGLERIAQLLERCGSPQKKLSAIHVAGTNGKGSTCRIIAGALTAAGYKTGLYISPAVEEFSERIQIDGEYISHEAVVKGVERFKPICEEMVRDGFDHPTEFEVITAMALEYFLESGCDAVVLETGLGGRFDATNVFESPKVSVITSVSSDHTAYLGDTVEKIAFEKAGILKSGCRAVTYPARPSVEAVFETLCRERNVPWQRARTEELRRKESSLEAQRFGWGDYPELTLHLAGSHQLCNAVVALECVEQLRQRGWHLPKETVAEALESVRWPARLEVLRRQPLLLLDGAHNPQCMEVLAENLPEFLAGEKAVFLLGVMADKEYEKMIALLEPFAGRFVCVTPQNDRALPGERMAALLRERGWEAEAAATVAAGVRRAVELAGSGPVVACGSLYMAGEIRMAAAQL